MHTKTKESLPWLGIKGKHTLEENAVYSTNKYTNKQRRALGNKSQAIISTKIKQDPDCPISQKMEKLVQRLLGSLDHSGHASVPHSVTEEHSEESDGGQLAPPGGSEGEIPEIPDISTQDIVVPGEQASDLATNSSVVDMDLIEEETVNVPITHYEQFMHHFIKLETGQNKIMDTLHGMKMEQQKEMNESLMALKNEFIGRQERGDQQIMNQIKQYAEYLRTQVADTIKWRLHHHHVEMLKDISRVMTPMADIVSHLQQEVVTCHDLLNGMVEEVSTIKDRILQSPQPATPSPAGQSTAIPSVHPSSSLPSADPTVDARLRMHSTMHAAPGSEPVPSHLGSPIQGALGGRVGKSPIKLQFPCFGRMGDDSDPLTYLGQCRDYLALNPLSDEELLATLRNVLFGTARDWWDVVRLETGTWREFEHKFLSAFLSEDWMEWMSWRRGSEHECRKKGKASEILHTCTGHSAVGGDRILQRQK